MTEKLIPYDGTRYLDDEEDIALYLGFAAEDATNENDPAILARAIKTIAKARGMTELAKAAGIPRDDLYTLLDEAPALEALHKLLADAGITPTPTTSEAPAPQKAPALAEA
jgi:probable addiction module antidote protein